MAVIAIPCQFISSDYAAEHSKEALAIAKFTSHNNIHLGSYVPTAKQLASKVASPALRQYLLLTWRA